MQFEKKHLTFENGGGIFVSKTVFSLDSQQKTF
jgi:hypothetical protein